MFWRAVICGYRANNWNTNAISRSRPRRLRHIAPAEHDVAAADRFQARDHAQGGGFAAAGRPEQHDELAVMYRQVHRPHGVHSVELFLNLL